MCVVVTGTQVGRERKERERERNGNLHLYPTGATLLQTSHPKRCSSVAPDDMRVEFPFRHVS